MFFLILFLYLLIGFILMSLLYRFTPHHGINPGDFAWMTVFWPFVMAVCIGLAICEGLKFYLMWLDK